MQSTQVRVKDTIYTLWYCATATSRNSDLLRLEAQALERGLILNVLGLEETKPYHHTLKLYHQDIVSSSCPENDILIFTDAYDVILIDTAESIIKKYLSFDSDIVFSAEVNCWPVESYSRPYPNATEAFPFLNSGGLIGKMGAFKECFSRNVYSMGYDDDQGYWTRIFLNNYGTAASMVKLDTKAELFFSLFRSNLNKSDDGVISVSATGTRPAFIHANGNKENFSMDLLSNWLLNK